MKKFVCTVCGYVHYGEQPPATCPVCHQPASKFREVENTSDSGDNVLKEGFLAKLKKLFTKH